MTTEAHSWLGPYGDLSSAVRRKPKRYLKPIGVVVVLPHGFPRYSLITIHKTAAEALAWCGSESADWWRRNVGALFLIHDRRHPAIRPGLSLHAR